PTEEREVPGVVGLRLVEELVAGEQRKGFLQVVRPNGRHRHVRLHARILSPFGSNSGSPVTAPGTHRPKISTSTRVPTSAPSGVTSEVMSAPHTRYPFSSRIESMAL